MLIYEINKNVLGGNVAYCNVVLSEIMLVYKYNFSSIMYIVLRVLLYTCYQCTYRDVLYIIISIYISVVCIVIHGISIIYRFIVLCV